MIKGAMNSPYWLLSDDRLSIGKDSRNYDFFIGLLKHTILFHESIIVPDSNIINNLNLRAAIKNDDTVISLFHDQIIKIASRKNVDHKILSLKEVRKSFTEDSRPNEFSYENYYSDNELLGLQETATFIPYRLKDVSQQYTEGVQGLFKNAAKILIKEESVLTEIQAHIAAEIDRKQSLSRSFFHYSFKEYEWWEKYQKEIKSFADAPYITALPDMLGVDAIYGTKHRASLDMIRGRASLKQRDIHTFEFQSKLSLASFAEGLRLLNRDSILDLLDSEEARNYFDTRNLISAKNPDLKAITDSLMCYQLRIEDTIINNHHALKGMSGDDCETRIKVDYCDYYDWSGSVTTLCSVFMSSPQWFDMLGLLFIKPISDVVKNVAQKNEAANTQKIKSGQRDWERDKILYSEIDPNSVRILAKGYPTNSGVDTLYL